MSGIKGQKSGGFGGRTGDGIKKQKNTFELYPEVYALVSELRTYAKNNGVRFIGLFNQALLNGIKNILKKD